MSAQIRVTVEDLATGETETVEVENDYFLICAGRCELANVQTYPTKGTHVLTVKNAGGKVPSEGGDVT